MILKVEEMNPEFKSPKAIADLFDAEMSELEDKVYDALFRVLPLGDPKIIKFLEITLARYDKEVSGESYGRAFEEK